VTKAQAKAQAQSKRATDRARHEREAFAKRLDAAKKAAETTPATGIVDDGEE
jgi:membrane protein involved in colicin uptake